MVNPAYISDTATTSRIVSNEEDERVFLNPLYSDDGDCSSNKSDPSHPYESIKTDTRVSISYKKAHGSGALSNEGFQHDGDISESCYSALDHNREYSAREPHIPKSYQEQLQPSEGVYSQLHHN
jgi:hypothetical protein